MIKNAINENSMAYAMVGQQVAVENGKYGVKKNCILDENNKWQKQN